ncbi:hypothetical protein A0H81_05868 [Grifola frondosa]|uniref:Uncharacterized protein n=1 Tax=Grifola frondosa TaxID=5627 RepID=A0A1C7MBF3_GRIFR|nr:hypothetical protein A0H81_05868 [Grifola frondosa]
MLHDRYRQPGGAETDEPRYRDFQDPKTDIDIIQPLLSLIVNIATLPSFTPRRSAVSPIDSPFLFSRLASCCCAP